MHFDKKLESLNFHLGDPQYAEQILNKIANAFDGTYAGLKSMLQRFKIYFALNPRLKGVESTS